MNDMSPCINVRPRNVQLDLLYIGDFFLQNCNFSQHFKGILVFKSQLIGLDKQIGQS